MSRIYRDSLTVYSTLWCPYGVPIRPVGLIPGRNPNLSIGALPDLKRSDEQTKALPFSLAAFKPNVEVDQERIDFDAVTLILRSPFFTVQFIAYFSKPMNHLVLLPYWQ